MNKTSQYILTNSLAAGSVIFEAGDPGDCAFIVSEGEVEIIIGVEHGDPVVHNMGHGQIFGEMALIDGGARSATARAKTDVVLHTISRPQLLKHVDSSDSLVNFILRVVLMRYRQTLRRLTNSDSEGTALGDSPSTELALPGSLQAMEKLELEVELEQAIERSEFELFYQPLVSLSDARLVGFEALIRWRSPTRGLVSPGVFIPLAEETGLVVPICRWALGRATGALRAFQAAARRVQPDFPDLVVSVNVTKHQIDDNETIEIIDRIFAEGGINRGQLKIELTESVLMDDFTRAHSWINSLRERSVRISIDDFGTGYSSLGYLHKFELDELKIDRSFVIAMLTDRKSMEIVRAVIGLARGLGLIIVAEGIEEPEQARRLRDLGVEFGQGLGADYGQGYGFCRPIEESAILELIQTRGLFFTEFLARALAVP